jgi:hypothetical protein
MLGQIRRDVRKEPPASADHDDDDHDHFADDHDDHCHAECDGATGNVFGMMFFHGATSPFWGPRTMLGDDLESRAAFGYFARFPYDDVPGYMMIEPLKAWVKDPTSPTGLSLTGQWPSRPRSWSARLRADYADQFDALRRISGQLLLSTRSRFGLDTETSYFEERLPGGGRDKLWLGDGNVVYRFAQGERAQFRAGLGFNWLDDPVDTNYGFNFTYGADFFVRRPWVLSAEIDWGTLGEAGLFRFRTTGGVIVNRVEAYTGYEYLDVGSTQVHFIMGGLRLWF